MNKRTKTAEKPIPQVKGVAPDALISAVLRIPATKKVEKRTSQRKRKIG